MKFIQTIENLYTRAQARKDGTAKINGRLFQGLTWGPNGSEVIKGDLEEKYKIVVNGNIVELWHWGTRTLKINTATSEILDYYGESNSDRDSMNTLLYLTNTPGRFRWFPSRCDFILEGVENYETV